MKSGRRPEAAARRLRFTCRRKSRRPGPECFSGNDTCRIPLQRVVSTLPSSPPHTAEWGYQSNREFRPSSSSRRLLMIWSRSGFCARADWMGNVARPAISRQRAVVTVLFMVSGGVDENRRGDMWRRHHQAGTGKGSPVPTSGEVPAGRLGGFR